jgi:hypothetical protein
VIRGIHESQSITVLGELPCKQNGSISERAWLLQDEHITPSSDILEHTLSDSLEIAVSKDASSRQSCPASKLYTIETKYSIATNTVTYIIQFFLVSILPVQQINFLRRN